MNPESFLILKTLLDDFITGVYYRSSSLVICLDRNCLKTNPEHVSLLTGSFFRLFLNAILRGFFLLGKIINGRYKKNVKSKANVSATYGGPFQCHKLKD